MNADMEIAVVGVMIGDRQSWLQKFYFAQEAGAYLTVSLEREPDNKHDANAIKVVVSTPAGSPVHVGYVARALAAMLAPRMDAGDLARVTRVKILEGKYEYRITYGVRVNVSFGPRPAQQTRAFEVLR